MINTTKSCTQCKQEQSLENFYKKKGCKYGVMSVCKVCWKQQVQEFQDLNKDIILDKNKQRYLNNKEKYSEYNRENYLKNQELRKEQQIQYNINNKSKRKGYNQLPEVKQRDNEYMKKYSKSTPEKHLAKNIRCSISMRLKEINSSKDQKTLDIVGLKTWEEFKKHIESQFTEGMNWGNYGNKIETDWSIDHIIPISTANTLEEVKKLNHYTNLQPLWHIENIQKRDKLLNLYP
jgi:hypothetical protein